jgi:hypothetical protein
MALIDRNAVPTPAVPKVTVDVPALGGEVILRGLLLSDRLELSALGAVLADQAGGENTEQAQRRAGQQAVFHMLARTVVLADGEPLFTVGQWDAFGGQHPEAVLDLYRRARALSGQDEEANKKN